MWLTFITAILMWFLSVHFYLPLAFTFLCFAFMVSSGTAAFLFPRKEDDRLFSPDTA